MSFPQYEFLTDRQIEKVIDYFHTLFKITPTLILLLVLWGFFLIGSIFVFIKSRNRERLSRIFSRSGCVLSILTILQFCLLNREKSSQSGFDLIPFHWVDNNWLHESLVVEAVLNFLVFVPFGIFVYLRLRRAVKSGLFLIFVSVLVESLQYITKRGTFSTEDMVFYTLGGLTGVLIVKMGAAMSKRHRKRHDAESKTKGEHAPA